MHGAKVLRLSPVKVSLSDEAANEQAPAAGPDKIEMEETVMASLRMRLSIVGQSTVPYSIRLTASQSNLFLPLSLLAFIILLPSYCPSIFSRSTCLTFRGLLTLTRLLRAHGAPIQLDSAVVCEGG